MPEVEPLPVNLEELEAADGDEPYHLQDQEQPYQLHRPVRSFVRFHQYPLDLLSTTRILQPTAARGRFT
jgi:hypothetical protein